MYSAYNHPGGMHPKSQIDFVKQKLSQNEQPYANAYRQLIGFANAALNHTTHAVADFDVPGAYVNLTMHQQASINLGGDSFDAYSCALAYHLSNGQSKYANQSLKFLKAWADLNTQFSNKDGSLVMVYAGTGMVMAGELLLSYDGWNSADKQKFLQWVRNVYLRAANQIRTRKNNWADWGRFGSILGAYLLDNPQQMTENMRLIKSDMFHKIADDGHMPEEVNRGVNGIWYTYFSLAPMTAACWVGYQATGENLFTNFSKGNSTMKGAIDYLYYYNLHPNEWKWFAAPNKGSPSAWPGVLLEAMASIFGDNRYVEYVSSSRPISYKRHHYAWVYPTLMKVQLNPY